jgi:opacity protein-like surface antigen
MGALDTPVSVGARNTYQAVDMDGGPEYAVAYSLRVEPTLELELEVSNLKASDTQRNAPGSGNEANRLNVDVELTFLRFTAMRRLPAWKHQFALWYGAGLNVGLIEQSDQEWIGTGAGAVTRSAGSSSSTAAGVHAGAGLDVYVGRTSAVALTLDARYNLEMISGSFDGEVNSAAFRVGLRWDFWPGTE